MEQSDSGRGEEETMFVGEKKSFLIEYQLLTVSGEAWS